MKANKGEMKMKEPSEMALQFAATAWCKDETKNEVMNPALCAEFAKLLENVPFAFNVLKNALLDDDDYAWGWHCNIAMSMYDGLPIPHIADMTARRISNECAARFMRLCFHVDMESNDRYKNLMQDLVCDGQ